MSTSNGRGIAFPETRWDILEELGDGGGDSETARRVYAVILDGYWYPVYAHLRSVGHGPHDAEDLTQGFFAKILRTEALHQADASKGKLRSFMLVSLKHYVSNQQAASRAAKRGHGQTHLPLHQVWAEDRLGSEPAGGESPDRVFNSRWWSLVLDQAALALRAEYAARGQEPLFLELNRLLGDSPVSSRGYAEASGRLQMSEAGLRVALCRLRKRMAEKVRGVLKRIMGSEGAVEEEIRALMEEGALK